MGGLGQFIETSELLKVPALYSKGEQKKPVARDKPTYQRQEAVPKPKAKPHAPIAIDNIRTSENANREGFHAPSGMWYPYHVKGTANEYDIGYGHKIVGNKVKIDGQTYDPRNGLTDVQINRLFEQDLETARKAADKYKRLNPEQKAALTDMFYQSGTNMRKYGPKAAAALERYEKDGKQEDLDEFIFEAFDPQQGIGVKVKKGDKPMRGLQNRVARRRKLFVGK